MPIDKFVSIFLFTDFAGNPITSGLNVSKFIYRIFYVDEDGIFRTFAGTTPSFTHIGNGYWAVSVNHSSLPYTFGDTYKKCRDFTFALIKIDPSYQVIHSPDFYTEEYYREDWLEIMETLGTAKDLLAATIDSGSNDGYSSIRLRAKENDDIVFKTQVPIRFRPLTGWTNLSIQMFPNTRATDPTVPPYSGTYSVSVLNATNGVIECRIGKDVTANKVPSGKVDEIFYADIQGDSPSGYHFTLVECSIQLVRDYNINNQ